MELRLIRTSELTDYLIEKESEEGKELPLTLSRAMSQVNSPYVGDEDILLITLEKGGELAGYMGILPCFFRGDPSNRFFFNSCWWVAPGAGAAVSMRLLKEFLSLTGGRALFSDLSKRTAGIIERAGFRIFSRDGVVLRFRPGFQQRSFSRQIKGPYKGVVRSVRNSQLLRIAGFFAGFFYPRRVFCQNRRVQDDGFELSIDKPGNEYFGFIRRFSESAICVPDDTRVQWWENYPWLVRANRANRKIARRYYFSFLAESSELLFPVLRKDGKIKAAGVLRLRDGVVKTHYLWAEEHCIEAFCRSILCFAEKNRQVHSLQSFHPVMLELSRTSGFPGKFRMYVKRFMSKGCFDDEEFDFQDGDGDSVFT